MASSTNKKVVVSRFDREPLSGFVNPQSYLQPAGIELLTPTGSVLQIAYADVKLVSFVRDFGEPESKLETRQFTSRPKTAGLWVRLQFRDGDAMDGLLPNNLLQIENYGFTMIPPDPGFQNQRIFVPRSALREVQVLGVVGSPLRKRKTKAVSQEQIEMFDKT